MESGVRNVVYDAFVPGGVWVERKEVKGRERECGMWPEERPARGSGSRPVNLYSGRDVSSMSEMHVGGVIILTCRLTARRGRALPRCSRKGRVPRWRRRLRSLAFDARV